MRTPCANCVRCGRSRSGPRRQGALVQGSRGGRARHAGVCRPPGLAVQAIPESPRCGRPGQPRIPGEIPAEPLCAGHGEVRSAADHAAARTALTGRLWLTLRAFLLRPEARVIPISTSDQKRRAEMEIKRSGSQAPGKGPAEYFTGTVRIDPLFGPPDPARGGAGPYKLRADHFWSRGHGTAKRHERVTWERQLAGRWRRCSQVITVRPTPTGASRALMPGVAPKRAASPPLPESLAVADGHTRR